MSDFDTMLWRPLRSGYEYEGLFPKSLCKSTYVGSGNTDFSIVEMEKVIKQYAFQTEKVARKLQKPTLKATTDNIHDFLFNHFQYLADESNQLLRSPACSWFTRKNGIDCKSYSILASCILLNLDIKHYIRKIKQPGYAPEEYTHVYVIVPTDQQTGSLQSGYYIIDGTLQSNIEPAFIGKSDLQMSLKHHVLNGAVDNSHSSLNGISISSIKSIFSFSKIGNIFNKVKCLGWDGKENSAYSESQLNTHIATVDAYFEQLFVKINQAVLARNYTLFSKLINEFYGNSKMFVLAAKRNRMKGWNPCTTARIDVNIQQYTFYAETISQLLTAWLAAYFIKGTTTGSVTYDNTQTANNYPGMRHVSSVVTQTVVQPLVNYTANPSEAIPEFILNEYVQGKANASSAMNVNDYLDALELAGNLLQGSTSTASGTNNPLPTGGQYIQDLDTTKTSSMGGWVMGIVVVGAGIAVATSMNKKN